MGGEGTVEDLKKSLFNQKYWSRVTDTFSSDQAMRDEFGQKLLQLTLQLLERPDWANQEKEDVAHEVCQGMIQALIEKRDIDCPEGYYFKILYNRLKEHWRLKGRGRKKVEDYYIMQIMPFQQCKEIIEEELIDKIITTEQAKGIIHNYKELTVEQRLIIFKRFYLDESLKKIGEHLKISKQAVKSRLNTICAKLEKCLIEKGLA